MQTACFILSGAAEARRNELGKAAIEGSLVAVVNGKASVFSAPRQSVEMRRPFLK